MTNDVFLPTTELIETIPWISNRDLTKMAKEEKITASVFATLRDLALSHHFPVLREKGLYLRPHFFTGRFITKATDQDLRVIIRVETATLAGPPSNTLGGTVSCKVEFPVVAKPKKIDGEWDGGRPSVTFELRLHGTTCQWSVSFAELDPNPQLCPPLTAQRGLERWQHFMNSYLETMKQAPAQLNVHDVLDLGHWQLIARAIHSLKKPRHSAGAFFDKTPSIRYSLLHMRMSKLFTKTSKQAPADAETANAKFLIQGGFVRQEMAGVYSWLPLGLRTLRKVEAIVREEMNALGAQEILMSALQPKENWLTTERWDAVDVLFKVPSQTNKEYALGPTHEEIVTPLVGSFINSYKDLPVAVYQLQTKFRDELRAKSGVMRGREFGMKDLYSFHATQEDLEKFYAQALEAYLRVFARCGVDAKVVEASGGSFTKKFSHEFQVLSDAGEDVIIVCECDTAKNSEIALDAKQCPTCTKQYEQKKGIEVGNIFDLGTKFSEAFKVEFTDEAGTRQTALMGCYGIGLTRLVGTIVEASHDDRGIIWPKSVAPFAVHLISLQSRDAEMQDRITQTSSDLYDSLKKQGIDVLWDDRDASAGAKLADADLIGLPLRLLISEKTLKDDSVEWKERQQPAAKLMQLANIQEEITTFVKE